MQELLFRVTKGEELTDLELDDNFRRLRAAISALEAAAVTPSGSNPIGTILQYAPTTLPTGYLWANGQSVSRATYSDLFTAIGVTYGIGDGVSTFTLPDFRGRLAIGTNPMGGSNDGTLSERVLGTKYGAESVNIPHSHTGSLSINDHEVSITPSGTVAVNPFVGTAPVSVTVTIGTTNISHTPTGTVTVDSAVLTADFTNIDAHTDIITEEGAGHSHTVITTPRSVNDLEPTLTVADDLVYATTPTIVSIDLSAQNGGLGLQHTGTQDLTHTHTASFTGGATNFNHTHTASGSGGTATLNHGHTATFSGALATQTLTHTGSVTVDSSSPSADIIPPSLGLNFIIKY